MSEAVIVIAVLLVAGIIGAFLSPTEEQNRPLQPEAGAHAEPAGGHHH